MRKLNENKEFLACPKPDIIVSELLGSFGDNEVCQIRSFPKQLQLSPECLDGITFFLKPTTISIPQSYTSYAAPIMSCQLHQNIRSATRSYYVKGVPGVGREPIVREKDGSYTVTPQYVLLFILTNIYSAQTLLMLTWTSSTSFIFVITALWMLQSQFFCLNIQTSTTAVTRGKLGLLSTTSTCPRR